MVLVLTLGQYDTEQPVLLSLTALFSFTSNEIWRFLRLSSKHTRSFMKRAVPPPNEPRKRNRIIKSVWFISRDPVTRLQHPPKYTPPYQQPGCCYLRPLAPSLLLICVRGQTAAPLNSRPSSSSSIRHIQNSLCYLYAIFWNDLEIRGQLL